MQSDETRVAYSVDEAAKRLSIGRTLVFRLIKDGELGSLKIGHRRLVAHDELESFVARCRERAA